MNHRSGISAKTFPKLLIRSDEQIVGVQVFPQFPQRFSWVSRFFLFRGCPGFRFQVFLRFSSGFPELAKNGRMAKWLIWLVFSGTPSRIRTCDPLLRRQMLYPPELWAHCHCRKAFHRKKPQQALDASPDNVAFQRALSKAVL